MASLSPKASTPLAQSPWRDRVVQKAAAACIFGFGGFLLWAGLAPLEEGVAAGGVMVVENSRQVVQHLEGGIIHALHVQEGDSVAAGAPLVTLAQTAFFAERQQVAYEIATQTAAIARLSALEAGDDAPTAPDLEHLPLEASVRADIVDRERRVFDQQSQAHAADLEVLTIRRDAAIENAQRLQEQVVLSQQALAAAREELELMEVQLREQMARREQVAQLRRGVLQLQSEIAGFATDREAAQAYAADLNGQLAQTQASFAETTAGALREAQAALALLLARYEAVQDAVDRAVITAPMAGVVLNLALSTEGGVVRPGEVLLEIVPEAPVVTAAVRIRPADRASVQEGQVVRTQITAYRGWRAPRLEGEITSVSADLKTDPQMGVDYYEARVRLPNADATGLAIMPGMPVQAFIFSGMRRTTLDYLFAPLGESLFRGLRSA